MFESLILHVNTYTISYLGCQSFQQQDQNLQLLAHSYHPMLEIYWKASNLCVLASYHVCISQLVESTEYNKNSITIHSYMGLYLKYKTISEKMQKIYFSSDQGGHKHIKSQKSKEKRCLHQYRKSFTTLFLHLHFFRIQYAVQLFDWYFMQTNVWHREFALLCFSLLYCS